MTGNNMHSFHYISNRIILFEAVTFAALAAIAAAAYAKSAPPWITMALLVTMAAMALIFIMFIMRPFMKEEQRIKLFLEGYTSECGILTPESDKIFRRMQESLSSSRVLSLNKRQAQYLALQNQINPHFLYNTLESIRSEAILAGVEDVADMTEALASFFRYTISKVENLVTVEDELHNCEIYFYIQKFRFGDRLEMQIECDPNEREEIYGCRIPKLTMQPILENSIIHGTEMKLGTGHLKIHLERSLSRIMIHISDDGTGMDELTLKKMNENLAKSGKVLIEHENDNENDEKEKGGIALVNVNNRIRLIFGEEYGIHVFSVKGSGTDVEISIPAITGTVSDRLDLERSGS